MHLTARFARVHFRFLRLSLFVALLLLPQFAFANVIYLTSGSSWTVPSDWNSSNNTIEIIGAGANGAVGGVAPPVGPPYGGAGGVGGGGGAYAKTSNLPLTPGSTVTIQVGSGDTYVNGTSCAGASACAKGASGSSGGSAASSVGTTKYSGGNGGTGGNSGPYSGDGGGGGGGGGAAGPHGPGNTGATGGDGTDSYGGASVSGGTGDTGNTGAGASGTQYNGSHGSGGGGTSGHGQGFGGGQSIIGSAGGAYGAGGGGGGGGTAPGFRNSSPGAGSGAVGQLGLIVITYTPAPPANCTFNGQTVTSGSSVTANQASSVAYGSSCVSQSRSCSNGTLSGSYQYPSCSVLPATPTGLSASCNAAGTQGTLTWTPVSGATGYYVRVDDQANPWAPTRCDGTPNDGNTGDICTPAITGVPPYTFTSIPNDSYGAWVHAINSAGYGNAAAVSFACAPTPPTCSVTFDTNPLPYGSSTTLRYTSTNASSFYINSIGYVGASGTTSVGPAGTTDYGGSVSGAGGSATCPATLTVTAPSSPTATITADSSTVLIGQSTTIRASFFAGSGDTITHDNIDSPVGTGVGASTNPDATKTYTFTPLTSGTYTFYAREQTSYYSAWTTYAQVNVTVPPQPTATLTLTPSSVPQGQPATLSWTSTNATSCTISGVGSVSTSGSTSVTPSQSTTYTGSCTGPGGTTSFNAGSGATLSVSCTAAYSCSGSNIQYTNTSCAVSTTASCVSPAFCSAGSSVCLYPAPSFNSSGPNTGHLQITPLIVPKGLTTKLFWNVSNVSSCSVSGSNGQSWNTTFSGSNGQPTSGVLQQTTFTLACPGLDGSSINESVVVNILPVFQEN